jgi:hypothetical protein
MQLKQGIYPELDDATYHNDPCPKPSLNQTTAKLLLTKSPMHAWHQHPRLNPHFERENNGVFDLGNVAHRLLLGKGPDIHRINADNYRTKEAQTAKARAYGAGAIPCLERHFQDALHMRDEALSQIREAGIEWLPETHPDARTELAMIWEEKRTWFRTKIDRLQPGLSIDYKTTQGASDPQSTMARVMNDGWHIQAAMHERALMTLDPVHYHGCRYLFIQQESNAPYALGVWEMPESILDMGRKDLLLAIDSWRHCILHDEWPGYNGGKIGVLYAPAWGINQWQERHATTLAAAE